MTAELGEPPAPPARMSPGKRFALGCVGCLGLVALLPVVVVALNWTSIRTGVDGFREELAEARQVRAVLVDKLQRPVDVRSLKHFGTGTSSLVVELQDPDLAERVGMTREIALLAAQAHPEPERFEEVRVKVSRSGGFLQGAWTRDWKFPMDGLLSELAGTEPVAIEFRAEVPEGSDGAVAFAYRDGELWLGAPRTFEVERAYAIGLEEGDPSVIVELVDDGAFPAWTATLVGGRLAVLLDGEVVLARAVPAPLMGQLELDGSTVGWRYTDAEGVAAGLRAASR